MLREFNFIPLRSTLQVVCKIHNPFSMPLFRKIHNLPTLVGVILMLILRILPVDAID